MNKVIVISAVLFLVCMQAFGQLAPDKLVFKGDDALIDSLKRTEYPYLFPIWGDKVRKLGITMPLSAGLGVNYIWSESELVIENISVGFNNGPMQDISSIVRTENAKATINGVNIRPDLFVLPFLNVYGIFGVGKTSTAIDASLWLPDTNNTWRQLSAFSTKANFDVQTFGFGLTPTFGLGGGWMAFDMNFAWTDVSALEKPAFSFVFGPRFGKTFKLDDPEMTVAVWVGAFRLNIAAETSGSLNIAELFPLGEMQGKIDAGFQNIEQAQNAVNDWWNGLTPREQQNPINKAKYESANRAITAASNLLTAADGALSNAESATVQYNLDKSQKKLWNFIVGGQFQLNEHWMVRAEFGFLGTRKQFLGGLQYRFGL